MLPPCPFAPLHCVLCCTPPSPAVDGVQHPGSHSLDTSAPVHLSQLKEHNCVSVMDQGTDHQHQPLHQHILLHPAAVHCGLHCHGNECFRCVSGAS
jgi:hypothetical protein